MRRTASSGGGPVSFLGGSDKVSNDVCRCTKMGLIDSTSTINRVI